MTITERQAHALANLLHELRPGWPAKSLITLIGKNRDSDFPALAVTAVAVATDSRNQTPAVIFLELARDGHKPAPQQFKTAAEKRLEMGIANAPYFAQMDREREGKPGTGSIRAIAAMEGRMNRDKQAQQLAPTSIEKTA